MSATPTRNGSWTLASVIGVIGLVSGLVIGTLGTLTQAQQRFITRERYTSDIQTLSRKLESMDDKLDSLVRAVERNTTRLESQDHH